MNNTNLVRRMSSLLLVACCAINDVSMIIIAPKLINMMLDSSLDVSLGLLKAMACTYLYFLSLIDRFWFIACVSIIVTDAQRKDAIKLVKAQMTEVKKEAHKVRNNEHMHWIV
jgi:hypothetical protein